FAQWFGTRHTLWLSGEVPGDDTDGHIDNLARFAGPGCALVVAPDAPRTDVERTLAANVDRIATRCDELGLSLDLRPLPLPVAFIAAEQLPASYANFYIGNDVVLAPVFADPSDDAALRVLQDAFPGRRIEPVDARALVVGLGTLHCLTQQVPAP
ncbi:MAG: agmatine deiminase family protein, partial [Pseudomonadota bacterium]